MVATFEKINAEQTARQADCVACLTRNCALNGNAQSPVTVCNQYRQANCAFCATVDCALNGQLNTPVMACTQFVLLGTAN
jgi:hypothetical protein